jgi:hypothetical protein
VSELLERLGCDRIEGPLDGRWEGLRGLDAEGIGVMLTQPE